MNGGMDDYEAIRQLTARYNAAGDGSVLDAWLDCFASGGSFRRSDGDREWAGREQLTALFSGYGVSGRHLTTDHIITVEGDRATQTCYLLMLDRAREFTLHMVGVYHDELVREGGRWRFVARRLDVDFMAD
jgi:hypothetical protein